MIMPKEKREILKEDIMPLDVYTKNRKELRKNIVNFKKDFKCWKRFKWIYLILDLLNLNFRKVKFNKRKKCICN